MRSLRLLLSGLVVVAATGCVTSRFTQLVPYDRPSRPVSTVEFLQAGLPNRPYQEVGIIRVRSVVGWDAAQRQLMEEGADRGCDAVAIINAQGYAGVVVGYYGAYPTNHEYITGACLLWTAAGGPPPAAPPPFVPPAPPPTRSDE